MRKTVSVALPQSISEWLDTEVERGGYDSASDYVRHLLEQVRRRRTRAEVDAGLMQALRSGPASPMTPRTWNEIRRAGRKRITRRKRA